MNDLTFDFLIKKLNLEQKNNISFYKIKILDFSLKKELFKYFLNKKTNINSILLNNLFLLIKPNTELTNDIFKSKNIFFNSLDEFLNIKLDLINDILSFKKYLIQLFLSMLKSLNKFNFSQLDSYIKMTSFDIEFFNMLDLFIISSFISEIDYKIDFSSCPFLLDAQKYFLKLSNNYVNSFKLINLFLSK